MSDEKNIDPQKQGWRTTELVALVIVVVMAMWVFWRYGAATRAEPMSTARDIQRAEFRQLAVISATEADGKMHLSLAAAMNSVARNIAPALAAGGGAPKAKAKPDKVITVTAFNEGAMMKYDKTVIEVKTGERVLIVLKNTNGPALPKVAMGHNMVILKKGVAAIAFGVEIAPTANLTNDFLPDSAKEKVLVYSKLLGPGETDEILFTAPEPGEYDYMCTFTGHFVMMRGKLVVKE